MFHDLFYGSALPKLPPLFVHVNAMQAKKISKRIFLSWSSNSTIHILIIMQLYFVIVHNVSIGIEQGPLSSADLVV